jgi:hypothetical protein
MSAKATANAGFVGDIHFHGKASQVGPTALLCCRQVSIAEDHSCGGEAGRYPFTDTGAGAGDQSRLTDQSV